MPPRPSTRSTRYLSASMVPSPTGTPGVAEGKVLKAGTAGSGMTSFFVGLSFKRGGPTDLAVVRVDNLSQTLTKLLRRRFVATLRAPGASVYARIERMRHSARTPDM